MRWKKHALALTGLALLLVALYQIGGRSVFEELRRIDPAAIVGAAFVIAVSTVLGAWNAHRIAELHRVMSLREFLPVFWRSWAVGISLPSQVADVPTTLWQLKGREVDLAFLGGRLVADKLVSLGMTLVVAAFVPWAIDRDGLWISAVLLAGLAIGSAVAFAAARRYSMPTAQPGRWWSRAIPVLAATQVPARLAMGNATISLAKLAVTGLAYWMVFTSIQPQSPGYLVISILSLSAGLVAYLPISFNGLGTVEISAITMFDSAGLGSAVVLSGYLVLRVIALAVAWLPTLLWGAFSRR